MRSTAVIAALLCARAAAAEPVAVKVTELAGDIAYITPGRAAGVIPGTKVNVRGRELTVVEVTEGTAALRVDDRTVNVGDTGTANVSREGTAHVATLPKPRPPEAFANQWPDAVLPASQQQPAPVPLGSGRAGGRGRVTVIGQAFGAYQRGGDLDGEASARVIASYDLLTDRPLAADVDIAGRAFVAGFDARTRTPLQVRAAQLRYGRIDDPTLALGRLRFAATSVGILDGARAAATIGNVQLAAFGGLVPDPLGGKPDPNAARFGAEFVYDDAAADWQPRVAVVAHGSTYDSALDERRVSVVASAGRDAIWFDSWAEAQLFDADNPWTARTIELTGGGASAEWRKHGRHVGLDATFLRPERSLRLAAALPAEWLCTQATMPGDVAEPCSGSDYVASASGSAGIRNARWTLDAVATAGRSHGIYRGFDSSGYVRGEVRVGPARVSAEGSAGRASFASWTAGEVGLGAQVTRALAALVSYRPELLDYVASTGPVVLHSLVVDAHYGIRPGLDLAVSAVATTGIDRDALDVLTTVVWRPFP